MNYEKQEKRLRHRFVLASGLCFVVIATGFSRPVYGQANIYDPVVSPSSAPPAVHDSTTGNVPIIETSSISLNAMPRQDSNSAGNEGLADAEAKKKQEELKKKVASAYKPVFFDNDFSYLCDENYNGCELGEQLKRRGLPGGGWYDIGGQYRLRGHVEQNMRGVGLTGVDDRFLLHRTRVYGDFHFSENIRIYAEMLDAESNYEGFGPRSIEVNRTELHNLFIDARLLANGDQSLTARIGRQELLFGSQRVVSPLDWANTRRTFEGGRLMYKSDALSLDGYWTNPVLVDDHSFDSPDRDQEFMGLYSSFKTTPDKTVDAYFLRYLNRRGANDFENNTLGLRWQGTNCGVLYDIETQYQFGENTDGSDHQAGMATFGVGRKLAHRCWEPTVWLYYDWASGDDATGVGNGYDHLFPLAHKYLGFMDLVGRRNIEDINFLVTLQPSKKLQLLAWYHCFFLETRNDTPYNVNLSPFNGGNVPGSADLGQEIDFMATYNITVRQQLLLGYSHFFAGEYYDTTAGVPYSGDANFIYSQWSIDF